MIIQYCFYIHGQCCPNECEVGALLCQVPFVEVTWGYVPRSRSYNLRFSGDCARPRWSGQNVRDIGLQLRGFEAAQMCWDPLLCKFLPSDNWTSADPYCLWWGWPQNIGQAVTVPFFPSKGIYPKTAPWDASKATVAASGGQQHDHRIHGWVAYVLYKLYKQSANWSSWISCGYTPSTMCARMWQMKHIRQNHEASPCTVRSSPSSAQAEEIVLPTPKQLFPHWWSLTSSSEISSWGVDASGLSAAAKAVSELHQTQNTGPQHCQLDTRQRNHRDSSHHLDGPVVSRRPKYRLIPEKRSLEIWQPERKHFPWAPSKSEDPPGPLWHPSPRHPEASETVQCLWNLTVCHWLPNIRLIDWFQEPKHFEFLTPEPMPCSLFHARRHTRSPSSSQDGKRPSSLAPNISRILSKA